MFNVSRPDRGNCSLLWNRGQSGRTPSWMQAFTGPWKTPGHTHSFHSLTLSVTFSLPQCKTRPTANCRMWIKCSHREVINRDFIFVLFCLKFIHELHHRSTEKRIKRQEENTKIFASWHLWRLCSVTRTCHYLGCKKSMTMLYSLLREWRKRRFQPAMMPSRLPNTLSTSQGKIRCSSYTHTHTR